MRHKNPAKKVGFLCCGEVTELVDKVGFLCNNTQFVGVRSSVDPSIGLGRIGDPPEALEVRTPCSVPVVPSISWG